MESTAVPVTRPLMRAWAAKVWCKRSLTGQQSAMANPGDEDDSAGAGHARGPALARRADQAAVLTPYPDGPLLLRGDFSIETINGEPIPAGRQTVALCRCGHSARKPFCDGSHVRTGFRSADAAGPLPAGDSAPAQRRRRGGRAAKPLSRVPDAAAEPPADGEPAAD